VGTISSRSPGSAIVYFSSYAFSVGSYEREIHNTILPAIVPTIGFHANLSPYKLRSPTYALLCDGAKVAEQAVPAGTDRSAFTDVDLSAIDDGWHLFDIVSDTPGETTVPHWMYVSKSGAKPAQAWAPVQTGSYNAQRAGFRVSWAKVPTAPTKVGGHPLAARQALAFNSALPPSALFRRDLLPVVTGDPFFVRTDHGLKTCLQLQAYALGPFIAKEPPHLLRDGPRGIGTVSGATHMQVGRRGGVYFVDSWRFGVVSAQGHVKTLCGWRHGDSGDLEMVGDWSAIPEERRGLHEAWGLAWDARTVAESTLDKAKLLDRGDGVMEHPHIAPPTAFISDSQNNRVLRVRFNPASHDAPAIVSEFLVGIADPWDVVYHDGLIYVSERAAHRIAAYDAVTGAYVRTLVQGAPLASWDRHRRLARLAGLDTIRAQDCVGPEGLYLIDGSLYFGSMAMAQVRRVDLATGKVSVVCSVSNTEDQYIKIAVSDGTFGPRGTVFCSFWENAQMGGPHAFLPDGKPWYFWYMGQNDVSEGRGGSWRSINYSTSACVGQGRLFFASSSYGISEITQALPSDPPEPDAARYKQGYEQYRNDGHAIIHGGDGYGQFEIPLPWGVSDAMDYYLSCHGHIR
jgi:hypothetical protein